MQFDAVVHSVFASAVNLKPSDGGQLLTLLAPTEGDLPQGIRLEASDHSPFEPLHAGMKAACRAGLLRFDGPPLTVDLREAACWDASLPVLQIDLGNAAVKAAWRCAWEALNNRQAACASELKASRLLSPQATTQPTWVAQASRCIRDLLDATLQYDPGQAGAIKDLIGLGPGLTPGGDDLLAGYLLGLRYATRGDEQRIAFLSDLSNAVIRLLSRTGDISGTYLYFSARGEPSAAIFGLASAICSAAVESTVRESAEAAMSIGHTSGMDAVTGLLVGMAAWEAPGLLSIGRP